MSDQKKDKEDTTVLEKEVNDAPKFVTVGCKLPNGLYLDLREENGVIRQRYRANGFNHPNAIAGFGLTKIPKDHWDEWVTVNAELDAVKNGVIFAHEKAKNTKAQAKDTQNIKAGAERLNPDVPLKGVQASKVS